MKLRSLAHLVAVGIVAALILVVYGSIYAVPSGIFVQEATPQGLSYYVKRFGREEQLGVDASGSLVMQSGTTIPFVLRPPRPFSTLTIELESPNLHSQREILVRVDGVPKDVSALLFIEDPRVTELKNFKKLTSEGETATTWSLVEDSRMMLFQRDTAKVFDSLSAFWEGSPDPQKMAVMNVNVETYLIGSSFAAPFQSTKQTFARTIRGSHSLVAAPVNGEIVFTFDVLDTNRYAGEDHVTVELMRGIQKVDEIALVTDDSATPDYTLRQSSQTVRFTDLPPAVYHVNLQGGNDTFFRNISSPNLRIIFDGRLMLADGKGYESWFSDRRPEAIDLTLHASAIRANTPHTVSLQTLTVDEITPMYLEHTGQNQSFASLPGTHHLHIPDPDVELTFDGVLLASGDKLVVPPQYQVKQFLNNADLSSVDYIISTKQSVEQVTDTIQRVSAELDLHRYPLNDRGEIRGSIQIRFADEEAERLKISRVRWTLEKEPIRLQDIIPKLLSNLGL